MCQEFCQDLARILSCNAYPPWPILTSTNLSRPQLTSPDWNHVEVFLKHTGAYSTTSPNLNQHHPASFNLTKPDHTGKTQTSPC